MRDLVTMEASAKILYRDDAKKRGTMGVIRLGMGQRRKRGP